MPLRPTPRPNMRHMVAMAAIALTAILTPHHMKAFDMADMRDWATSASHIDRHSQSERAATLIDSLKADHATLIDVAELAEALLYDPASDMADEGLYDIWTRTLIERGGLSDVELVRPMAQLEEMAKNALGSRATDAEVTLPDGSESTLLSLIASDGDTLILFYDPDCHHCDETIAALRGGAADELSTNIVAVCVEGDEETWRDKMAIMPAEWTHAYATPALGMDADDELYVFRTMPSIYILSPDATVKAKNVRL